MTHFATSSARIAALLALAAALACAYPESSTHGRTESPAIVVVGAPQDAVLVVDGITVGPAADYTGEKSLTVLPGRHVVELQQAGRPLVKREIFVDSQGTKTIDFTGTGR